MTDAEVLAHIGEACADIARPAHFADHTHCCECAEHDALLLARDLATLKLEDVGNGGWDPICFVSDPGFFYYLPALARLCLDRPRPDWGWYYGQFLFHLTYQGHDNRRLVAATPGQRDAVALLVRHVDATRAALVKEQYIEEDHRRALELWAARA
jgi:hypothetical protein